MIKDNYRPETRIRNAVLPSGVLHQTVESFSADFPKPQLTTRFKTHENTIEKGKIVTNYFVRQLVLMSSWQE